MRDARNLSFISIIMSLLVVFFMTSVCATVSKAAEPEPSPAKTTKATKANSKLIERGKYLVNIMACHDCHTPWLMGPNGPVMGPDGAPEFDMKRQLSGHPEGLPHPNPIWTPEDIMKRNVGAMAGPMLTVWSGPWGVSFTQNLTPDKETGLGEWTEESFIQAIRTGKHQGQANGRAILPPMPWPVYKNATDADLKAIWAFLRSLSPIKNKVPEPVPPATPPQPPSSTNK